MEIGLVSCTKSKREQATEPADLYMPSTFFSKAREYVEANHDRLYILSAKHHLLDPSGPSIEPYVFHAGRDYYDELIPLLDDTPVDVETPTDGLQFGETLAWYNENL